MKGEHTAVPEGPGVLPLVGGPAEERLSSTGHNARLGCCSNHVVSQEELLWPVKGKRATVPEGPGVLYLVGGPGELYLVGGPAVERLSSTGHNARFGCCSSRVSQEESWPVKGKRTTISEGPGVLYLVGGPGELYLVGGPAVETLSSTGNNARFGCCSSCVSQEEESWPVKGKRTTISEGPGVLSLIGGPMVE